MKSNENSIEDNTNTMDAAENHSNHSFGDKNSNEPSNTQTENENEIYLQPREVVTYFCATQGCRSVEEFECLNRIEEGAYGVVYRAKDKISSSYF